MKFKLLFIGFLVLVVVGCQDKHPKKEAITQMEFSVTDSLLSLGIEDTVHHTRIKFPKYYLPIDLDTNLTKDLKNAGIKQILAAQYVKGKSIFMFNDLNNMDETKFLNYVNQSPENFLKTKQWKKVQVDSFYSNNIFFKQFCLQSDSLISFKIILPHQTRGRFEVDFVMPLSEYNTQNKLVESVLGSIK